MDGPFTVPLNNIVCQTEYSRNPFFQSKNSEIVDLVLNRVTSEKTHTKEIILQNPISDSLRVIFFRKNTKISQHSTKTVLRTIVKGKKYYMVYNCSHSHHKY